MRTIANNASSRHPESQLASYVLFFIHLELRRITLAGFTRHPTTEWMLQMARNGTDETAGFLAGQRYLLHDRDAKFCAAFQDVLRSSGVQPLILPPSSPNLTAFAERWVRTIKHECLSKLVLFGQASQILIPSDLKFDHTGVDSYTYTGCTGVPSGALRNRIKKRNFDHSSNSN